MNFFEVKDRSNTSFVSKNVMILFFIAFLLIRFSVAQDAQRKIVSSKISGQHISVDLSPTDSNNVIKWQEIFDSPDLPAGWQLVNLDSSAASDSSDGFFELVQQVRFSNDSLVAPQAGQSFFFSSFNNANDRLIDEWIITPLLPAVESGDSLAFYAGAIDEAFKDSLIVMVAPSPEIDSFLTYAEPLGYFKVDGPTGAWNRYSFGLGEFEGEELFVAVNYFIVDGGRFGAHSDNVWVDHFSITNDTTITTGINTRDPLAVFQFQLLGNYPNPFNPSTQIAYQLQRPGDVEIDIYTVTGQHVKQLIAERQGTGEHRVRWLGLNSLNQPVSSGLYLYQIRVDGLMQSGKMLLVR